eukprot:NODE_430_length_8744_cov_0.579988.p1 type:complete len:445 gc:universal NODE_430_length_8744_cov_0.579988:5054-6388(+)
MCNGVKKTGEKPCRNKKFPCCQLHIDQESSAEAKKNQEKQQELSPAASPGFNEMYYTYHGEIVLAAPLCKPTDIKSNITNQSSPSTKANQSPSLRVPHLSPTAPQELLSTAQYVKPLSEKPDKKKGKKHKPKRFKNIKDAKKHVYKTTRGRMEVFNLKNSSKVADNVRSKALKIWLTMAELDEVFCQEESCNRLAEHGGHIESKNSEYIKYAIIIPLCAGHNNPSNVNAFFTKEDTLFVVLYAKISDYSDRKAIDMKGFNEFKYRPQQKNKSRKNKVITKKKMQGNIKGEVTKSVKRIFEKYGDILETDIVIGKADNGKIGSFEKSQFYKKENYEFQALYETDSIAKAQEYYEVIQLHLKSKRKEILSSRNKPKSGNDNISDSELEYNDKNKSSDDNEGETVDDNESKSVKDTTEVILHTWKEIKQGADVGIFTPLVLYMVYKK